VSPKVDVSMPSEEIDRFLDVPRTGVLATVGRDGWPHMAGMWFARSEGGPQALSMWAYRKSQKVVNLRRDPRCSFMVEAGDSYDSLKGVLIRGEAQLLDSEEDIYSIGVALYERYTLPATGIAVEHGPEIELRRQAQKRTGIVVPIERVASWDHSKL
jgi:PPOX class probable F420-dependent enzyme